VGEFKSCTGILTYNFNIEGKNMTTNGKGKSLLPEAFKGQEIEFPVSFQLKAVLTGTSTDEVNKEKLEKVFAEHKVKFKFVSSKASSKGAYTSYTYQVDLENRAQMDSMYDGLKKIEELKFAL
jgi:putative lipoic acid-binding regulatory protein